MRIDGLSTAYLPERSKAPAAASFQEVQREQEVRREQPQPAATSQGIERYPLVRQVEVADKIRPSHNEPISLVEYKPNASYFGNLSMRAMQALAAYTSTASFTPERDAYQIVGLDLYV